MNTPKVTIVTVTYNCKELLEETILSVINQTYKNIEYIIIDGASTDGTLDIIKKYEKYINYWISEPDNGIYYAMNKGIEKATGEWINFMNAGDVLFNKNTVSNIMKSQGIKYDFIYGNYIEKQNNKIIKPYNKSDWLVRMPFCHQTLFVKINIMKVELFDISYKLAADHNFILKMYLNNRRFFYFDETIVIFSLGGFANQNIFLANIESLKVLLDNKVHIGDIKKSHWYNSFKNDTHPKFIKYIRKYIRKAYFLVIGK